MTYNELSSEQRLFIDHALAGRSVIVDACIGSGKTTAIQCLCQCLPPARKVLYLTYNKLLKLDAKEKIIAGRADVTNYHGYAYRELLRAGHRTTMQDCIRDYVSRGLAGQKYDVLILDEYQDIDHDIAAMLMSIRDHNPGIQIVAVGDMAQKIYDRTTLRADAFIRSLLPEYYARVEFIRCFRLSEGLARVLGRVWGKTIVGVNPDCEVRKVRYREAFDILAEADPGDVLCLGANYGPRVRMLNDLEKDFPRKYNKYTAWSKVTDREGGATAPGADTAIFTTFDGCKGMERDLCVVFDFTSAYWTVRLHQPEARYEIIRNIFLVAASRGKRRILFVEDREPLISEKELSDSGVDTAPLKDLTVSTMFDFKFSEDVEAAYDELDCRLVAPAGAPIEVQTSDGLIDLSFCIGTYAEAGYFCHYNMDKDIRRWLDFHKDQAFRGDDIDYGDLAPEVKVLFLAFLETGQDRYWSQVDHGFILPRDTADIARRLSALLPRGAIVQQDCGLFCALERDGRTAFRVDGICDVIHDGFVWELKFVSELSHVNFLQAGMYSAMLDMPGRLWNIRTGELWDVRPRDKQKFLSLAVRAATKGRVKQYYPGFRVRAAEVPGGLLCEFFRDNARLCRQAYESMGPWPSDKSVERWFRNHGVWRLPAPRNQFAAAFRDRNGAF